MNNSEAFPNGRRFYYIKNFKVEEKIVHSGISPMAAYTLSKIYVIYDSWSEANEALKDYQNTFVK